MKLSLLISLESRKIKIRHLFLLAIPITLALLFATFTSIYGINQDHASSFGAIIKMMTCTVWDFYIFYTAYLISKIIVEEYVNHTVTILFTYSIKRTRIFLAKIILTSVVSLTCQFLSQIICFVFVIIADSHFSLVNGVIHRSNYLEWLQYTLINLLAAEAAILFISVIALIKKSVSSVFLSGIGFLFIYQMIVSQINAFSILWICFTALFVICAVLYIFSAHHWMNKLTPR
ncbi:ABC-2 family transporter protein [Lachnospiraceae bacterium NK3A20]|nr:ABC-2 family transporter protein [Lachnospiraceae bacterium NK3A20]